MLLKAPHAAVPVRAGSTHLAASRGEGTRGDHLRTIAAGALAALAVVKQQPAGAASLSKANTVLSEYGLPPILSVPDGFSPLVEVYGKASGADRRGTRDPLLVQFVYPSLWIVTRPNVDKNGEAGTLSAGDYQKGDNAALYVANAPDNGKLDDQPDSFFADTCEGALRQKGDNQYQTFKFVKRTKGPTGPNGAQYYVAEFKYELYTGAGFVVERHGLASITQVGKSVQALVTATTAQRWKKLKGDLQTMVESFRVYDGIAV